MTRYPSPGFAMRPRSPKEEARRKAAIAAKAERRQWADAKGTQPARDPAYRTWIASLPCLINDFYRGCSGTIECAHVGPIRGLRQKCSDYETVPLCIWHHRTGRHSHHVLGKLFWAHYGLDRDAIIADLRRRYAEEQA